MKFKTLCFIIGGVVFLVLLLFLWQNYIKIDRALVLAEEAAAQAQEELTRAEIAVDVKARALARVTEETQVTIEKAEEKIKLIRKEEGDSLKKINKLTTDNQALKEHIKQLSSPDVLLDPEPVKDVLINSINLYPQKDFIGAEFQANEKGQGLFQLMVEEIRSRRDLDLNNEVRFAEFQNQISRLTAVIKEHEIKYQALTVENLALKGSITALENNLQKHGILANKLQNQVDLYKKRFSLTKTEKGALLSALALAIYIGVKK